MDADWLTKGRSAAGFKWHGPERPNTRKAIVDLEQKLKQIWYLERAVEVSRSVGRVYFPGGKSFATCFLVGPNLILTNHHVFGEPADTEGVVIQFNYRELYNGELEEPDVFACDASVFVTDPALDFSLTGLKQKDKPAPGFLSLRHGQSAGTGSHLAIIQHPNGEPLQVAMRDNSLAYADQTSLQYLTNTEYGSSGSPVFNDNWNVIALHSQRVPDPDIKDKKVWYRNMGFRVEAILKHPVAGKLIP